MQVACCQFDVAWEDKPANFRRVEAMVGAARLEPGTLLVLPEMFATGFSMNADRIAEPPGGPTHAFLSGLAARHRLYAMGGVVTSGESRRPRNECAAFGPDGGLVSRYAKLHRFSFAGEHEHYSAGDALVSFDWAGCAVTPAVCYDLRFPELFRRAVVRGTTLFTITANWPAARESHWLALLKARAIENQAYVAAVNRCGKDPKLHYSGRSQVIDPRGEVIADAGDGERIVRADVNLEQLREYRGTFPALRDIRDDLFPRG